MKLLTPYRAPCRRSGRGNRLKRPSTKAVEAGLHAEEEEVRQVAKRKGKPSRRQTTDVQTAGGRSKCWLEKLKQDAEADPDGPRAIMLKAHRDARNASEQVCAEEAVQSC